MRRSQLFSASPLCHLVMKQSATWIILRYQFPLFLAALGHSSLYSEQQRGAIRGPLSGFEYPDVVRQTLGPAAFWSASSRVHLISRRPEECMVLLYTSKYSIIPPFSLSTMDYSRERICTSLNRGHKQTLLAQRNTQLHGGGAYRERRKAPKLRLQINGVAARASYKSDPSTALKLSA